MAPIKWHQCTPPPVPAPVSPLPMAAQSRAPPQPPPSPLLTAPAPAPLSAPPPWPPYGGGRGGEGREGAGGGREPSGSGRSRHLPLPPPPGTAQPGSARHGSARPRVEPGHRGGLGQAGSRRGAVAGGRRCCPGLQRGPCPPSHPSCRRHSCSPRPLRVTVSTATAAAAAAARTRHPPPARRHHRGLWEQRAAMCTLCVPEQTLSRAPEDFFSLFLSSARPKRKERFLQLGSRRRERRSPVSS
ncbi:basic proline-rich protein-like isoform X3 [Melopsittacus undulatus]|uniref:basic proline-rich protein-like isoform X3 n=1 Tax=Melopsittacus undulatus TaxID=13146 RepID=UPI00146B089F|nr:basic proline-rich protein-like isoform X3 [Melopsittacus undulatus]